LEINLKYRSFGLKKKEAIFNVSKLIPQKNKNNAIIAM
jgi:hypothetical protein